MAELFHSLPAAPVLCAFVQYLVEFYGRPEAASDVISGLFCDQLTPNKSVKFRDVCLNRYQEIPPEVVGGGIFDSLVFAISSNRKLLCLNVLSDVAVESLHMHNILVKVGDSRSHVLEIFERLIEHTNERTNMSYYHIRQKRLRGVSLKTEGWTLVSVALQTFS